MGDLLFGDTYEGEGDRRWSLVAKAGSPWVGVYGKATQGVRYQYTGWLRRFVTECSATDRLGLDWGFGTFHYFDFAADPIAQADKFLQVCELAAVWTRGTFWPAVDSELGGQHVQLTKTLVENTLPKFVEKVSSETGRPMILYTGQLDRELGITNTLGCRLLWTADYEAKLARSRYESIGFRYGSTAENPGSLFAWQGVGVEGGGKIDGEWKLPTTTPIGPADISTVTIAGGGDAGLTFIQKEMFVMAA